MRRFVDDLFYQILRIGRTDKRTDVGRHGSGPIQRSHKPWRIAAYAGMRRHVSGRLHLSTTAVTDENPQDSQIVM